MLRERVLVVLLLGATAVLGATNSSSAAHAESFDKPLRKTVVDLGPSAYLMPGSKSHIQLYCAYYPDFMVKELDDPGLKGTLWVTIAPIVNGHFPKCRRWHDSTERFFAKGWWGFIGVKGQLLFLQAADGSSGGMPFRILDLNTGKKIFEDSARWDGHLEFAHTPDGKMTLRYLRVVEGDCSIPKDGMSCWSKLKRRYGLAFATVPKCTGYRHEGEREWGVGDEGVPPAGIKTPSAIVYPAVVELFPRPSIQAIPGPMDCGPIS
jgi:hypothetical protein